MLVVNRGFEGILITHVKIRYVTTVIIVTVSSILFYISSYFLKNL